VVVHQQDAENVFRHAALWSHAGRYLRPER
jgi:hypothetical protein